jgi:hypothetical protein
MKTIALTEETAPRTVHSRILFVVSGSRPQSSAFTMRRPAQGTSPLRRADSPTGAGPPEDFVPDGTERLPGAAGRGSASGFIGSPTGPGCRPSQIGEDRVELVALLDHIHINTRAPSGKKDAENTRVVCNRKAKYGIVGLV